MNKLTILGLLFLISCNSISQPNLGKENNYIISVDKFLIDKNISQLAKDLYLGKVKPTNSNDNLALIDSINSSGKARQFYFLVITKTMEHADGAYAEPLGMAAKEFVEKNTVEFLLYFKSNPDLLTEKDFVNWALMTYGEIQISSEGSEQETINDLKSKMTSNCTGLSFDYKTEILKFIGLMK